MVKLIIDALSFQTIIEINKEVGGGGLRDIGTLEHIVLECGKTKGINRKASALLYEIATKHPFWDGNKRTAFASAEMILNMNGKKIVVSELTKFDLLFRMANRQFKEQNVVIWVFNHTQRI